MGMSGRHPWRGTLHSAGQWAWSAVDEPCWGQNRHGNHHDYHCSPAGLQEQEGHAMKSLQPHQYYLINMSRPDQNDQTFADIIFQYIFLNEIDFPIFINLYMNKS